MRLTINALVYLKVQNFAFETKTYFGGQAHKNAFLKPLIRKF